MANMSYCRFQNTAGDLEDCYEHWDDELSDVEKEARKRLLLTCQQIVIDFGEGDDD